LKKTAAIGRCPTLFQERIVKSADIRITVVDQDLQAVELTAFDHGQPRLDIRRNNMVDVKHRPTKLPITIVKQIRRLLASYGLRFAAIDLLRDANSKYVFLEINPNGQWAWLDLVGASNSRDPLIAALRRD
jgi:glutathione synthase/RimK-type ligase-like ATP-grasp enzyme